MQESNYSNSLKNLNYLLGDTTHSIYRLTDSFEAIDEQYNYSDLRQKAFENNSTLKNQYLNQKILQNNIGLAKSSYYPTLSLSTGTDYIQSWNFAGGESADDYTYDFYVNLTLSYTLYGAGSKKRQMQKALISQDIGEVSIAEMQHKVENDLYRLYDLYLVRKQLLKVSIEAEQSAALNLELGNERFKNGTINSFNLRDLTIYYMNAANQRLESTYNLIQGHTELLRITGGIVNGN
jgi:outer membrane protein TolC